MYAWLQILSPLSDSSSHISIQLTYKVEWQGNRQGWSSTNVKYVMSFQSACDSNGNKRLWPWMSRIHYFENNRQNLSSHLELVILENRKVFVCYLSKLQAKDWLFSKNNKLYMTRRKWQATIFRYRYRRSGPPLVHDICKEF